MLRRWYRKAAAARDRKAEYVKKRKQEVAALCVTCGAKIAGGDEIVLEDWVRFGAGGVVCVKCATASVATCIDETQNPQLQRGIVFGAIAALASTAFWYWLVMTSNTHMHLASVVVAFVVARAVMLGTRHKRGRPVQLVSVGVTAAALALNYYLQMRYFFLRDAAAAGQVVSALPPLAELWSYGLTRVAAARGAFFMWPLILAEAFIVPTARCLRVMNPAHMQNKIPKGYSIVDGLLVPVECEPR